jgi:hypothetical protein
MKTHATLNLLIHNLKSIGIEKTNLDGSISLSNLNTDIHFFNSFNQTIVAIECLKPKVESKTNKKILEDIYAQKNQIGLPNFIMDSTSLDDLKIQLTKPFIIIENLHFILRISIFDSIENAYLKNGLLKLLAVHNKEYNLKPKKNNTFYEKENTVFDLITSITLCRLNGNSIPQEDKVVYEWNGYQLVIEMFGNSEIENLKTFYPIKGEETDLTYIP